MTVMLSTIHKAIRSDTPSLPVVSFTTTVGPYRIVPFSRGDRRYDTGQGMSALAFAWRPTAGSRTRGGRFASLPPIGQDRTVRGRSIILYNFRLGLKNTWGGCRFVPWLQQGQWTARVGNFSKTKLTF